MNSKLLLITGLFALLISQACTKNEIYETEILPDHNHKSTENLEVIDGLLHFKTMEAFDEVTQSFRNQEDADRLAWENSIGFKSFRTIVNKVYEQIDEAKTMENLADILDENSNLVSVKNVNGENFILPSLEHPLYSRFINIHGLYLIGRKAVKITSNFQIITDISNLSNLKNITEAQIPTLSEKEFLMVNIGNPARKKTTATSSTEYLRDSRCKNERCIVTRMGSNLLPKYNASDQLYFITTAYVSIETWKKTFLCYWTQYATEITRNDVSYTYELGASGPFSDTWSDYTTPSDENGLFDDDILYTWPINTMGITADMTKMYSETTHRGMDGIWNIIDYEE